MKRLSPPAQPLPSLSPQQIQARRFYFAQYVADYSRAFGRSPLWREFRPFFIYATRRAAFYSAQGQVSIAV